MPDDLFDPSYPTQCGDYNSGISASSNMYEMGMDTADLRVRRGGGSYHAPNYQADFSQVFGGSQKSGDMNGKPGSAVPSLGSNMLPGLNNRSAQRPQMSPQQKLHFVALCGAAGLIHLDLNMAAPHLSTLANEFGLTPLEKDTKLGGMIQFGFFLVGGICSLVIGPLADQHDRVLMLCAILAFSAFLNFVIGVLLPGFKVGFFYFFICRVLSGISIGGCFPVLYSLAGDIFPSSQRSFVAATIGASGNIGAALGSIYSGLIGNSFGWRSGYLTACIAQAAFVGVVKGLVNDPRRDLAKAAGGNAKDWAAAWSGGRQVYNSRECSIDGKRPLN